MDDLLIHSYIHCRACTVGGQTERLEVFGAVPCRLVPGIDQRLESVKVRVGAAELLALPRGPYLLYGGHAASRFGKSPG